jgi:AcrR family transcriptional regulator
VLGQHGVEGMTMDRVAAAANLAKGSLYCYFESKQELLEFVHMRIVEPIAKSSDDVLHSSLPPAEKLEAMLRIVFDHLGRHHGLFRILLLDDARLLLRPSRRTHRDNAIRRYAAVFREGIDEGLFQRVDPEHMAVMLFGAMVELWHHALATGEFRQPAPLIESLVQAFVRSISVAPRAVSKSGERRPVVTGVAAGRASASPRGEELKSR